MLDRPADCVLFRLQPRQVLEIVSGRNSEPEPFLRLEIYLAAPKGALRRQQRVLVLLHPLPVYGGKLAIVGQSIHPRLVQPGGGFWFAETNSLSEQSPETLRLLLRWSRWQVGQLASGARESYSLLLDLQRSCLPKAAALSVKECAVYADFQHAQGPHLFRTNHLQGTLELNRQRYENGQGFFSGQIALTAQGNPELDSSVGQRQLHFRVRPDGEFETTTPPPP